MKAKFTRALAFIAVIVLAHLTQTNVRRAFAQQANSQPRTAGNVFKNIKVLRDMPASQLQSTMLFISASLGVDCSFCHMPPAMEKDDKSTKQTARQMMLMMSEINKNFEGKTVVNCATCHRGQNKPAAAPPLALPGSPIISATSNQPTLPTVDEILDRFVRALGGRRALDKITTRTKKGSVQIRGLSGTFELYEMAPDKSLLTGTLPAPLGSVHQGFDGRIGWVKNQTGVFEMSGEGLAQSRREANFYVDTKLKEQFTTMSVVGRERAGSREFYVIEGTRAEGLFEKLYFDVETGLLVRRYWENATYFGKLPNATDFDNYRKVNGVLFPFNIRRVRAGNTFLQFITELKVNTPLDDSIFKKPVNTNKP